MNLVFAELFEVYNRFHFNKILCKFAIACIYFFLVLFSELAVQRPYYVFSIPFFFNTRTPPMSRRLRTPPRALNRKPCHKLFPPPNINNPPGQIIIFIYKTDFFIQRLFWPDAEKLRRRQSFIHFWKFSVNKVVAVD